MHRDSDDRARAIGLLNRRPEVVAISLLRSQTLDLFAERVDPGLRPELERLRRTAPDGTKVAVEAIERRDGATRVHLADGALDIPDPAVGGYLSTPGGGLCNLAKDLDIILRVIGEDRPVPPIEHLSWQDTAAEFPGTAVPGRSRTSLVLRDDGFDKLILTEKGPAWDRAALDPWAAETAFYGDRDAVVFVGQEPPDSPKFDHLRRRKLRQPGLRVFWLVGGNQLKRLFTQYRDFLGVVDVVSLNLAEACGFFGFEPLRRRHRHATELRKMVAREISRRALELGAANVVITDGANGASLARKARGGRVEFVYSPLIHGNIVEVDPAVREDTGCGDSFAAAVAACFLADPDRFKLNQAANFAHYVAGIVYQRRRPNLTAKDLGFVEYAWSRAHDAGPLVSRHETFDRTRCQIRPAEVAPRGPRRRVLVLLVGGDPADPTQPHVTGAGAAIGRLAALMRSGEYASAPLVRIVARHSTHPAAKGVAGLTHVDAAQMARLADQGAFAKELGTLECEHPHAVRRDDLAGHEGVSLLRATLLEALEVMSSEDFAELFEDIKFWHFATEDIDQRIAWHAREWGVTAEQGQEIVRQSLRDYVVEHMGPQYRFSRARAATLEEFHQEMTEQLILRLDALLAGVFRGQAGAVREPG